MSDRSEAWWLARARTEGESAMGAGIETETIDRLFLELSQFTRARSRREIELESALRFYAEERHYRQTGWQGDPDPPHVMADRGKRAREALKI